MGSIYWDDSYYWDDSFTWDGEGNISPGGGVSTKLPTRPSAIREIRAGRDRLSTNKSKSWDKWATTPTPTQARAFLGNNAVGVTFPFNPDTVSWDYQENIFSQDTLGGRVVQLLSVGLNGMVVQGRAGSRHELQRLAKHFKEIMNYHVTKLVPVYFRVPSRGWNFQVYLKAVPQLTWDVASTSYPYQLELLVDEDLSGVKTREVNTEALKRLASGVGHDSSKDIHGGDAAAFREIVDILTANGPYPFSTGAAKDSGAAAGAGTVAAQDCTGPNCTVAAFCTELAKYMSVPTSADVITFLVAWCAHEGGSINNSYTYNLMNTQWTNGVKYTKSGSFPAYASFADGVKALGETLLASGHGYEKILAALRANDINAAALAAEASDFCAGSCTEQGLKGKCCNYAAALLNLYRGSAADYAKRNLPR